MSDPMVVLLKATALSFLRAFVGAVVICALGVLTAPNFTLTKASLIALLIACVTAGLRAVQALLTSAEPTDRAVN